MFNFNQSKKVLAIVGCAFAGLLSFNSAQAANPLTVIAEVAFVAPIDITQIDPLRYGLLDIAMAGGDTITIPTAGPALDPQGNIVGGTQNAALLSVSSTVSQPINILVNNPTNGGGAYSLATFMCAYNGGGAAACDGAFSLNTTSGLVSPASLLIGATLTAVGVPVAGTFNGSFDVTISYQ
jgi:hypothetical protein